MLVTIPRHTGALQRVSQHQRGIHVFLGDRAHQGERSRGTCCASSPSLMLHLFSSGRLFPAIAVVLSRQMQGSLTAAQILHHSGLHKAFELSSHQHSLHIILMMPNSLKKSENPVLPVTQRTPCYGRNGAIYFHNLRHVKAYIKGYFVYMFL